jgi:signal transduction histidine kinase
MEKDTVNRSKLTAPPVSSREPVTTTRLYGRWLAVARVIWLVIVLFSMGLFFASIPSYYHYILQCLSGCADSTLAPQAFQQSSHGLSAEFLASYFTVLNVFFAITYFVIGWVIFWHKSDDKVALFAAFTLITFAISPTNAVMTLPSFWGLLGAGVSFVGMISLFCFFYIFPDGRFAPRWTLWSLLGAMIFWGINFFVSPSSFDPFAHYRIVAAVIFSILILSVVVAQVYRYLYISTLVQRQQTKWVFFGTSIGISCFTGLDIIVGFFPDSRIVSNVIIYIIFVTACYCLLILIPLSISFAIFRSRLWEIDSILNRTLVYGTLTTWVIIFYVLVVGGLGLVFQAQGNLLISLVATSVIAILFQPLRNRLQRTVNRFIYGERDDPYSILSRLSQQLETTLAQDAVLTTIVETVALALKLPYAAISLEQDGTSIIAASFGKSSNEEAYAHFPLLVRSEMVGELMLAPRLPGETFTAAELRLLQDFTYQVGMAVSAQRLAADLQHMALALQHSRERIVLAREEERRRLRRDLHDDLGPTLAALALNATTMSDLIPTDPNAAIQLANELQSELRVTIGHVRRLAYELRPPTLDELGLVAAMRERAMQLSSQPTGGVQIRVQAPEALPVLPAAVEVATYRIVQEALTNITRHAHAQHGLMRLSLVEDKNVLQIEVIDDGIGLPQERHRGVGLFSMRERAEELGGSCTIEKQNGSGTRVCAQIPLSKHEESK